MQCPLAFSLLIFIIIWPPSTVTAPDPTTLRSISLDESNIGHQYHESRRLLDFLPPKKWQEKMIGNQSAEELEYPKLHKCVDLGEAYSAAYLTSKLHLMEVNIKRNLSMVRC